MELVCPDLLSVVLKDTLLTIISSIYFCLDPASPLLMTGLYVPLPARGSAL